MSFISDILQAPFSFRQKRLLAERESYDFEMFCSELGQIGADREISEFIWNSLCNAAAISEFKPHPTDNFHNIYGLADEELDEDIILVALDLSGVSVPSQERSKEFGIINTPVRLIEFIKYAKS